MMRCPSCTSPTAVYDSRPLRLDTVIRRRRKCPTCKHRFSTYEMVADDTGAPVPRKESEMEAAQ